MTALNPNPPQSTLLPICHLLEPGEYERRRWKTLRVEDEFLDPFLAEKQLEDQRVMVAKNRNPQASRLTAADVVRSKSFDAPRRDRRAGKGCEIPSFSAVFHSFRLIFGRAIISWNASEAWMLWNARARNLKRR